MNYMLREGGNPINLFYPHHIYCGCPQPIPGFLKSYGFYYVQWYQVRGALLFYYYWWNCWQPLFTLHFHKCVGPSWSLSYCSWIYNYLCNQCLIPLKLWFRIPLMARCTRYNIIRWNLSVTFRKSVVFSGLWYCGFLH